MNKISFKIGLLYVFLTVVGLSVYTVTIYMEQIGIIAENRELKLHLKAEAILRKFNDVYSENLSHNTDKEHDKDLDISIFSRQLEEVLEEQFLIYTESGDILYASNPDMELGNTSISDAVSAVSQKEFLATPYLLQIIDNDQAALYFPLETDKTDSRILLIPLRVLDLSDSLQGLYRVVFFVIIIVLILQIIFGVYIYGAVIRPIKAINLKSLKIKAGDLSSRVRIRRKDEIGQLASSFNSMAASIEKVIEELNNKNKLMKFELDTAGCVQAGIYPKVQNTDAFDIAVYHRPLEVASGDYHDIVRIDDHHFGFLVVDVAGHGVSAALMTMLIQNTFKRLVYRFKDPGRLFAQINKELNDMMDIFSSYFTAFFLMLDTMNNTISYVNGGHPSVYILKYETRQLIKLNTEGFAMGVISEGEVSFQTQTRTVDPGDKIILYTDGIIEAVNTDGKQFSLERLKHTILKYSKYDCNTMKERIVNDLDGYIGNARRKDDETLIIVKMKNIIDGSQNHNARQTLSQKKAKITKKGLLVKAEETAK